MGHHLSPFGIHTPLLSSDEEGVGQRIRGGPITRDTSMIINPWTACMAFVDEKYSSVSKREGVISSRFMGEC